MGSWGGQEVSASGKMFLSVPEEIGEGLRENSL